MISLKEISLLKFCQLVQWYGRTPFKTYKKTMKFLYRIIPSSYCFLLLFFFHIEFSAWAFYEPIKIKLNLMVQVFQKLFSLRNKKGAQTYI